MIEIGFGAVPTIEIRIKPPPQPTKTTTIATTKNSMSPSPINANEATMTEQPKKDGKTTPTGMNKWLLPPKLKSSSRHSRGRLSAANGEPKGNTDEDGFITSGRAIAGRGRNGKSKATQLTSSAKAANKASRQQTEAMEKLTKGATAKVAKAAGCAKNHEAPRKLTSDDTEEGSQAEL